MKSKSCFFSTSFLAVSLSTAAAAPIAINGPLPFVHAENFDVLGTAAVAFVNDSTLPGWFAQINNGATANGNLQVSDGAAALNGLLNLGATGAPDRALGSKATSTNNFANISLAVSYRNNSAVAVKLSEVKYTGELWRTNTTAGGQAEHFTVYYQVSTAGVTNIISGPSNTVPAAGAGFTALGAGADWTSPTNLPATSALDGNLTANRAIITFVPTVDIVIPPGQFLMLKWTDTNEANGTDGFQGLDDVQVTFGEVPFIAGTAGTPVRDTKGTGDPADDEFSFPVTVTTSSTTSTSWISDNVPTAGSYGVSVPFGPFPAAAPVTINFTTVGHAGGVQLTAPLTVSAPPAPIWLGKNELGAVPVDLVVPAGTVGNWVQTGPQTLTLNNSASVDYVASSPTLSLIPGTPKCVSVEIEYEDLSTGSNSEADDTLLVELVTDLGTQNLIQDLDLNGDGKMNGAAEATFREDEFNPYGWAWLNTVASPSVPPDTGKFIQTWQISAVIPPAATTAFIRVTGNNDSATEFLRVRNIRFRPCVDTDGDGVNDAQEEAVGSNPNLASSHLAYSTLLDWSDPIITIFVSSSAGRDYQLQTSNNLSQWVRAPGPAMTGTGLEIELLHTVGVGDTRRFFKVQSLVPATIVP